MYSLRSFIFKHVFVGRNSARMRENEWGWRDVGVSKRMQVPGCIKGRRNEPCELDFNIFVPKIAREIY